MIGALIILLLNLEVEAIGQVLVPFAAADLIPELRKDIKFSSSLFQLIFILIGLGIMYWLVG